MTPIPFAGSRLGGTRRFCAFFDSNGEAYRVALPFCSGRPVRSGSNAGRVRVAGRRHRQGRISAHSHHLPKGLLQAIRTVLEAKDNHPQKGEL